MAGSKRVRSRPLKSNFNFGGLAAENNHLLSTSFLDNGDYEVIASRHERRCFIIGRTGSGKSAALGRLVEKNSGRVITIAPENLSLPYLTNLGVVQHLMELEVHLEPFFIALWKHVMLVEIIKHRYGITSPEAKRNILQNLRDRIARDPTKVQALRYLEEFGDKFWCQADERVRQVADSFVDKVSKVAEMSGAIRGIGSTLSRSTEQTHVQETRQDLAMRYQQIVNETQLPRLNGMIAVLNEDVLDSHQHFTYLIIDDLDKEWVDERLANTLIRCLFQAVSDMLKVKNLKVLVALRTNIFRQLNYGERSHGGQEEKFRGMGIFLRWTENDLRSMLQARVDAAGAFYQLDAPLTLSQLLPSPNRMRDPVDYILGRTLMRPRDAILFLNACAREATGKRAISWEDIVRAEYQYSRERLDALRDEWKNPYPGIDRCLEWFRGKPSRMGREELRRLVDDMVVSLLSDRSFPGVVWLTKIAAPLWQNGINADDWEMMYGSMVDVLYEIGFVGLVRDANRKPRYSFDQLTAADDAKGPRCLMYEIHPAFRRALNIKENAVEHRKQIAA